MSGYKKILVAVDLTRDAALVTDKALRLANQNDGVLHLLHVMEPILPGYAMEMMSVDIPGLQAESEKHARNALSQIGVRIGVPAERLHTVVGNAAHEIRTLAKTIGADLIIMGGHGKHGLELLLGSTSSAVTHGVSCDLLIVRLPG